MKIISFKTCPYVHRVLLILEAKGLDYEVEYIDLSHKPSWFLKISPHQQVPILITQKNTHLFESEVIAEYLEETYPPTIHSKDPEQRAQNRAWAAFASKCYPLLNQFKQIENQKDFEEGKNRLQQQLAKMENQLQEPYFREKWGWVDLAWIPLLYRFFLLEKNTGADFLDAERLPKVKAWQHELIKMPWTEKSIAFDFAENFYKRYITPTNYLGSLEKGKKGTV